MKILAKKREKTTKRHCHKLRREGQIPAVLYAKGMEQETISVAKQDFEAVLRKVNKGELSTVRFEMEIDGKTVDTMVKEIQYERVSYKPLHIDFLGVDPKQLVKVNVPIRYTGAAECIGVKLGGVLRPVLRYVKVQCLPADIPAYFELDVASLGLKQSRKVGEIAVGEGIRMISGDNEVVITIAKR